MQEPPVGAVFNRARVRGRGFKPRLRDACPPTSERRVEMNYRDIITIEPDKRSGKPCIRGMRITVYDVLAK